MLNIIYKFLTPQSIIFGYDSINSLPSEIKRLGGKKILIVTDPGIIKAGLIDKVSKLMIKERLQYEIYDNIVPDPPLENVEECLRIISSGGHDLVIGVGGGSVIDIAKYSSALYGQDGSPQDFLGIDKLSQGGLPKIVIPTTSGSGSEVSRAVVLKDDNLSTKKACWSQFVIADSVIIDPQMTMTMPPVVTADTGMDALVHAIEAFVSIKSNVLTDMFAINAVKLIEGSLRKAYTDGSNLQARLDMCMASAFAGLAFSNAGLGAVHALTYPLNLDLHLSHGRSVAVLLPYILEFNMQKCVSKYSQLAAAFSGKTTGKSNEKEAKKLIDAVVSLARDLEIPLALKELGIKKGQIEAIGKRAYEIGNRLLDTNPQPVTVEDSIEIYSKAYKGY
jgi:alcohol dehydrogenase class IV